MINKSNICTVIIIKTFFMETKELIRIDKTTQKVQLIKGSFTPSEASDIITALIDEKINFHKIQRLQVWEGNHRDSTPELNSRIEELKVEKQIAKDFISGVRSMGKMLKINGTIEISVVDHQEN